MTRFLRLVAPLAIAICSVVLPAGAEATFPGKNGKIIGQTSYRTDGSGDVHHAVFTLNPDGAGRTVINSAESGHGLSAHDGTQIAFQRGIASGCCFYTPDISTMKPDGSNVFTVVDSYSPPGLVKMGLQAWSPDGRRLLFSNVLCHRCEHPEDGLWTIAADGTDPRRVSDDRSSNWGSWSPDSARIAYASDAGVFVVDATGGTPQKIAGMGAFPSWSPRGQMIAYTSGTDIYTVRPDGTHTALVAHLTSLVGLVEWSHDGTQLLFASGNRIYKVNSDGTGLTPLASGSGPIWSPDGQKIAFNGVIPSAIWVMDADGSNQVRLTDPANSDSLTDWQPIPGPKRSDYRNANQFCKAEQAFWGKQFSQRYRNFGQCVSA